MLSHFFFVSVFCLGEVFDEIGSVCRLEFGLRVFLSLSLADSSETRASQQAREEDRKTRARSPHFWGKNEI